MRNDTDASAAPVLNLPLILNIVWRGRVLLALAALAGVAAGILYGAFTPPLYLASTQVRPGIVSYSDAGGPVREHALRDIVHWFASMFYAESLELDPRYEAGAPLIQAEFIPPGPQFTRGGDIVTLTTLDPDPDRAVATLTLAIDAFNDMVTSQDVAASTITLTRRGTEIRMNKIRNDVERMEAERERAGLQLAAREREIELLDARIELAGQRVQRLDGARETYIRAAEVTDQEIIAGRARLAQAESLLAVALAVESGHTTGPDGRVGDNDPVTEMLLQTANREQAGQVGDLLRTVSNLEGHLAARTVAADTLRDAARRTSLEMAEAVLERDTELPKRRQDVKQAIADLRITLARDLPWKRAQFDADLEAEQARLDLLIPLERVGAISVTGEPVRPRKLRATTILTVLAFAGGLFLVFAREYFRSNREAILADRPPA